MNFFLLSKANHAATRLGHCTLVFVHIGCSICAEEDDVVRVLEVSGGNVSEKSHFKSGLKLTGLQNSLFPAEGWPLSSPLQKIPGFCYAQYVQTSPQIHERFLEFQEQT